MGRINGINYITYESKYDRPLIIMVHGLTQNHKIFSEQINCFKEDYSLLLADLRGHGESLDGIGPYGITEYTEDIDNLISKLTIQEFYFWGTHTGTAIGLLLALKYRERIKALIFEGTVLPGFNMPEVNELILRAKRISIDEGLQRAKYDWFKNANWFEYTRSHPLECRAKEYWAQISEFRGEPWISQDRPKEVINVDERLSELTQPILIYNGKHDMVVFIRVADRMESKIQQLSRKVISNAGGFPCWENPKAVNQVVKEFLENFKI